MFMKAIVAALGIPLLLTCVGAACAAQQPRDLDAFDLLRGIHAEQLISFASGIDARDKCLGQELRDQAVALAKKFGAKSDQLKALPAKKQAPTAEETEADKALRAQADEVEKERLASEAAPAAENTPAYPPPQNIKDEFEAIRYEILSEQAAFAEELSLDPREPMTAGLRQSILKNLQPLVAKPRWRCEKSLKDRIAKALSATYRPWDGDWQTKDRGVLNLAQKMDRISGTFEDGSVIAIIKDRVAVGQWKGKTGSPLEFKCSLADGDNSIVIEVSSKAKCTGQRATAP
jgi:hypothetical protein